MCVASTIAISLIAVSLASLKTSVRNRFKNVVSMRVSAPVPTLVMCLVFVRAPSPPQEVNVNAIVFQGVPEPKKSHRFWNMKS